MSWTLLSARSEVPGGHVTRILIWSGSTWTPPESPDIGRLGLTLSEFVSVSSVDTEVHDTTMTRFQADKYNTGLLTDPKSGHLTTARTTVNFVDPTTLPLGCPSRVSPRLGLLY